MQQPQATETWKWGRLGDGAVLAAYAAVVLWTLQYHEKWADEAQAWLIARELDLKTIWFHELRYEGSPGLWHTILWVAQHVFHAKYGALGYIGASLAIAGAAVVLWSCPFPRGIRYLLLFGFFLLYQYAVVARPYVLFACFAFVAAREFRDRRRPELFALAVGLLACLTAHGSIMGAALATVYAVQFIKNWNKQEASARTRFLYSAAGIALLYVCLFLILRPPADVEKMNEISFTAHDYLRRSVHAIGGALVDNSFLSVVVLALFAAWCYTRKALWSFLLPVVALIGFYAYVDGWAHQQGTIFLAILAGLAIAWPGREELLAGTKREVRSYQAILAFLTVVLCYHVYAAASIIRRDVLLPYSGADDAAEYLRPLVSKGSRVYSYQYGNVAVGAHFEQNIFSNRNTAYYHHSYPYTTAQELFQEITTGKPDYVVLTWWEPWDEKLYAAGIAQTMRERDYSLAHASDGFLFTKDGWSNRQIYLIFRRNSVLDQTAVTQPR